MFDDSRIQRAVSDAATPDLSVVIPNWNGEGLIQACLDSIRSSGPTATLEVIVVDNGSTDGSPERLARDYPWVTLIRLPANVGFARACNAGIEESRGRFVFVLNADTEVGAGSLDAMVGFLDENPDVGALNPKVAYPDGTLQPSVIKLPTFAGAIWEELFWHTPLHRLSRGGYKNRAVVKGVDYTQVIEMEWIRGSSFFVRRAVLEQVGTFDPGFFFGFEEHDLSARIRAAGWRLVWMPKASITHAASSVGPRFGGRLVIWLNDSRFYYWRKRAGRVAEWTLRGLVALGQLFRVVAVSAAKLARVAPYDSARIRTEAAKLKWSLAGRPPIPEAMVADSLRAATAQSDKGSHSFIVEVTKRAGKLLDLGCNDGGLTSKLAAVGGREIVAMEIRLPSILAARRRCSGARVGLVVGDAGRLPFDPVALGSSFDGVVMADVLEHTESPAAILAALADSFRRGGRLRRAYVSVPNVAFWRIRTMLLSGRFEYADCGILDRTHRWFFTLDSIRALIEGSGWDVMRCLPIPGNKGIGWRADLTRAIGRLSPTLFAPQFVFECVPKGRYVREGVAFPAPGGSTA